MLQQRQRILWLLTISQISIINGNYIYGGHIIGYPVLVKPLLHKKYIVYLCAMIIIGNTLLSDELLTGKFLCDLPICHGGCCIEGDAGAPLDDHEKVILEKIYLKVRPLMIHDGIKTVEEEGAWVLDMQGGPVTPLVKGKQCAYVYYDDGIAKCAIEKAFESGIINFRKPVSCHLYPIRVTSYPHYDALNYHRWPICDGARKRGKREGVRIYKFVKDALIRKYGQEWYDELEAYVHYTFENE
jgi:hypothetical protein